MLKDVVERCFAALLRSFVDVAALLVAPCSWPAVFTFAEICF